MVVSCEEYCWPFAHQTFYHLNLWRSILLRQAQWQVYSCGILSSFPGLASLDRRRTSYWFLYLRSWHCRVVYFHPSSIHLHAGPDKISAWLLRENSAVLCRPLCSIFNASVRKAFIPSMLKSDNVNPIQKCSPPLDVDSDFRSDVDSD